MGTSRSSRRLPLWIALVTALGWSFGSACGKGTSGTGDSTSGAGGSGVDYNGTTGSGDETINNDVDGEDDPTDPNKPECAPDSVIDDMGNCIPSCDEAGGYCAEDDPTVCSGYPAVNAYDCTVCCAIPDGDPVCPPEGCTDADCPPGEDCSYTDTCPDGVCSEGESCSTCPVDCGPCESSCGDGVCDPERESCSDCPDDCGACAASCGDGVCSTGTGPDAETCESCPQDCGNCLKVLTWDIGAGLKHGKSKVKKTLRAIAGVIAKEKPHFVGLQSVDYQTKRSGGLDEALYIARRVKMYKRFGAAFKYDGGQHGLAFFSKHPIIMMEKTKMATSGEWAKRRILLTATVAPPDYYTDFSSGVTALAKKDAPRLMQAATIADKIGFEADAMLVGDLFEAPTGPAIAKLQESGNLLDLWPTFGSGTGLTTKKNRFDYIMAGLNWTNVAAAGTCATVVRTYVKPAKGLSSHRPVIAVLQQGFTGIDCGTSPDSGGNDEGAIGTGDADCVEDEDCAADPIYRYCINGFCGECRNNDDCTDPEAPTCDEQNTCY
jgi:endonuclease/exonuclease/phosphatase family metal-dependent hydrolase